MSALPAARLIPCIAPVTACARRPQLRSPPVAAQCAVLVEHEVGSQPRLPYPVVSRITASAAGLKRGCRPAGVARVALPDIAQKTFNCTGDSFFDQLLIPAACPLLRARRHEHLETGVGKDHGPHVPAVGDEPGRRRNARWRSSSAARTAGGRQRADAAALTSSLPDGGSSRRGPRATIAPVAKATSRPWRSRRALGRCRPTATLDSQRLQRNEPVERAAVEQVEAREPARPRRDGSLAGGGGPSTATTGTCDSAAALPPSASMPVDSIRMAERKASK